MKTYNKTQLAILALLWCTYLIPTHMQAQWMDDEFHYGFSAGATYSDLSNITTSIIRPVFDPSTYSATENAQFGVHVGFFLYNRFRKSALAIQPEISYAQYGGQFDYNDIDDLKYTMSFKYDYFNITTLLKVHPTGGLFVGLGPQVGFNISDRITYKSNRPLLGPDLQVERNLQEVLKGRTDFSVIAVLGYEFERGFVIEARYKLGVSDAVQTLSNGFYFIENDNNSRAFHLSIGYAIPFY
jgi:hypothetical protein